MVTKKELRIKAKSIRTSLDIEKISEKIIENILSLEAYQKAQNILLFYPLVHEINLLKILESKGKSFYLPRMNGEHLEICPYKLGDELTISEFRTKEPITKPINDTNILDVIFVPALMVDKYFNRLGYGGGFYDKFLAKLSSQITKITPIASALIIEKLPEDIFDQLIDIAVCENEIFTSTHYLPEK